MSNLAAWITVLSTSLLTVGLLLRLVWIGGQIVQRFGDYMTASDKIHHDQETRLRALESRPRRPGRIT